MLLKNRAIFVLSIALFGYALPSKSWTAEKPSPPPIATPEQSKTAVAPPETSTLVLPPAQLAPLEEVAPPKKWSWTNESEAGISLVSGNVRTQSYVLRQKNGFTWKKNEFLFGARFLRAEAEGEEKSRNWGLNLGYQRDLYKSLGITAAFLMDSDIFAGILQRYHWEAGPRVVFFKKEKLEWKAEFSYRFTIENRRSDPTETLLLHYLRLGTSFTKSWTDHVATEVVIEYLPNLSNFPDWQLNTDLNALMTITKVLSFKLGYTIRYDHLPAATAKSMTDSFLTTSLVAKLPN